MKNRQAIQIKNISDKELIWNLYLTQGIILLASFLIGIFLFQSWEEFTGIFQWDPSAIFLYGGGAGIVVVCFDLFLMKVLPEKALDDGGINERIFSSIPIPHIFVVTLIISVSEELLFRGVLQTNFGIIAASLLFAIFHIRYLSKIILFVTVVGLSFFLGWVYLVTENLLATIFSHFTIDFILGCLIRLKHYNKPFDSN
ncbi:CPBP family intramembrane glutamic endopeptidase [Pseudalkalibacillus caeni]|uniref:CPBP family intramembrane metalloprotease n=1 Tax=Exobacillus caeni TaxID=2574798 RepID=A0A5R9EZR9_9BACL|nr:CPBP family intramembrane glutamic endopeptidase [Pseudalkalibacillus caeni]TLS35620.1 CPBP family intramembrane metalloprotease [Pseudalkalibacillus caeni]